ncbi:FAD/NAD(P)-binding protein [Nodosilinea sp. E11]|uniref:FAD/NAD(P)-binding protein n=1 Tax=Nodosilinea sp. E11 TaxID=3037479 RepID=UPI002934ACDD|nr:FAD/NAD(P)-binding protein [Nodosilinea sp. E11]WOD37579.1 FAD/NAD(P)-binding protein [Nodosilinea sp. E11]
MYLDASNGYPSQIFEAHNQPGGLCTAWQRQGYTFDAGIHYIFGTGEGQPFYELWHELGAFEGTEFTNQTECDRRAPVGWVSLDQPNLLTAVGDRQR